MKKIGSTNRTTLANSSCSRKWEFVCWIVGSVLLVYGLKHFGLGQREARVGGAVVTAQVDAVADQPSLKKTDRTIEARSTKNARRIFLKKFMAQLAAEENPDVREENLAAMVDAIDLADIRSTLTELESMNDTGEADVSEEVALRLIHKWVRSEPELASAWAQELQEGAGKQAALTVVATDWANSGLNQAVAWGQQLAESPAKQGVLLAIANEAVRSDPATALCLATSLPADEPTQDLIQRSAREWASQASEQAVGWANQIADQSLRATVLASMAVAISEKDPVLAGTLATSDLTAGRAQSDAVIGIIERWGQQDPEKAAAWVERFPETELKAAAIQNLVAMWSLSDSAKAKHWEEITAMAK